MTDSGQFNRRAFLRASAVTAFSAAWGSFSFKTQAGLAPAGITVAHLTDTRFPGADDPPRSGLDHPGWLFGEAYALSDDLMGRIRESAGPVSLVLHGGNLLRSGRPSQARGALDWLAKPGIPLRLTLGLSDTSAAGISRTEFISRFAEYGFGTGLSYYAHDLVGFHFIHLDCTGSSSINNALGLHDPGSQLSWLDEDLARHAALPTVMVLHAGHLSSGNASERAIQELIQKHPKVLLMLIGGKLVNRAQFMGQGTLALHTCSPVIYPCGARLIQIEVQRDGKVTIRSEFLQTRRLELVEKSFHQVRSPRLVQRLGDRADRSFTALPEAKTIQPQVYALNPALAPWGSNSERVTLAVVSDTHISDDGLVKDEERHDDELIGHFTEQGSKSILSDILAQVAEGRHRVEFYDDAFMDHLEAQANYLELPVDALLIDGDLSEHGDKREAQAVLQMLSTLPSALRDKTMIAAGNHDFFNRQFATNGTASRRDIFSDFYKGYGFDNGATYYARELTDWLTLLVLDSVIPTQSCMGFIQEQLDWLEDLIEQRKDQTLLIACHHPLYPISLVPPLMQAYLRKSSHFDPRLTAARVLLYEMFAGHNNVKLLISGHYHGVCVDQYRKHDPAGSRTDDAFTTHVQVPCTVEYPCGYRLFKIARAGREVRVDYVTAYTREAGLRRQSSEAKIFKLAGTGLKVPHEYEGTLARLSEQDNLLGDLAKLNPYDLIDLNLRGFKDGTARDGRGNTHRNNINGKLEFTIA